MMREQYDSDNIAEAKSLERQVKESRPIQLFKISHERNDNKDQLERWAMTGFQNNKTNLQKFQGVSSPRMVAYTKKLYAREDEAVAQ